MRWIWLKRASKYLCIESDQKGPLIYALNLTEKGLQIFMRRIWPKRASDLCVDTRRTLAQLRTNKSPFLLSYLHKIDASTHPSPLCPLCRTHEHTTQHLFSCPQIPTTLSALDLWRDPSGVAALLDNWREKLAANPQKTTEADSPQ